MCKRCICWIYFYFLFFLWILICFCYPACFFIIDFFLYIYLHLAHVAFNIAKSDDSSMFCSSGLKTFLFAQNHMIEVQDTLYLWEGTRKQVFKIKYQFQYWTLLQPYCKGEFEFAGSKPNRGFQSKIPRKMAKIIKFHRNSCKVIVPKMILILQMYFFHLYMKLTDSL